MDTIREDTRKLRELPDKPTVRLTGIKRHGPMSHDLVGDWFAGDDAQLYLRVYHHEGNITIWYRVEP